MPNQPVYVLGMDSKPLYPTRNFGYVRILLKNKRARVVNTKPFTIQLLYEPEKRYDPPKIIVGIDPGRKNIGISAITSNGDVIYSAHVTTRNSEIPKLMLDRKLFRHERQRHEREKRIRRAIECNTTKEFPNGRILPGCKEPILLKHIINSEARFNNRKRIKDWITPSCRQLVQTHISIIKNLAKLITIDSIVFEWNKFSFMELEDKTCRGIDFQNGRLKGYKDKYEYIDARQNNLCAVCNKKPIEHYHHIVHRQNGGSDLPENLLGVCCECHKKIHLGKCTNKLKGIKKKYHHLSVLNQAVPFIVEELKKFNLPLYFTTGKMTHDFRLINNIPKDHHFDATCIAASYFDININNLDYHVFEIQQFRNHNRQINIRQTERRYYLGKEHVATNRRPRYEQKGIALSDWFDEQVKLHGLNIAEKLRSQLIVKKSIRAKNNLKRYLPGTIFKYNGKRYVQKGIDSKIYFKTFDSDKKIPIKKCRILYTGSSLIYI